MSDSDDEVHKGDDNDDDIPDHLICPVCFNLPEKEVFQCRDGHVLCSKCFYKMKECPQCRGQLDKKQPIRNRHFEQEIVGFVKVDCKFKGNGCNQKIRKGLLEDHHKGCSFNHEKFGFFTYLCNLMNYECDFRMNGGNTERAVAHFVSKHAIKITHKKVFEMELSNFKAVTKPGTQEDAKFWTPVIADLQDKKCFVITSAVYNPEDDTFGWLSLKLPYSNSNSGEDESLTVTLLKMEYVITDGHKTEPLRLSLTKEPMSLNQVTYSLPSCLPRRFSASLLNPYFTKDGSLKVICKVQGQKVTGKGLERFKCSQIIKYYALFSDKDQYKHGLPNFWDSTRGSARAKAALDKLIQKCEEDEKKAMEYLENIDNGDVYLNSKDDTYFRKGAYFALAVHGTEKVISYWMIHGDQTYHEMVNENGETLVHCAMQDKNLARGFEKVVSIIKWQTKFKTLDQKGRNALHWAAWRNSEDAVSYFLAKQFNINQVDTEGKTPLHYAMMGFTADEITLKKVQVLLHNGANPNIKDLKGKIPLDLAFEVKCDCRSQLKQLIKKSKSSQSTSGQGVSSESGRVDGHLYSYSVRLET